jgi:predicted lipoprotein with Yx(FWY)xxD motif
MQSAYKGHPLYFFAGDAAPGDTKGRGVNNVWDSLDPRVL